MQTTTTKEDAMDEHMKAAGWVEHHTRQLAGAERILARRRERGSLAAIAEALAMVQGARRDLAWWQRRLDAIECPEA